MSRCGGVGHPTGIAREGVYVHIGIVDILWIRACAHLIGCFFGLYGAARGFWSGSAAWLGQRIPVVGYGYNGKYHMLDQWGDVRAIFGNSG